uniref:Uncharacterized protein n=1 Tax=Kalanchoe fedtschenkoi TaxID=63787 RepID=A0A7N0SWY8_KALFE
MNELRLPCGRETRKLVWVLFLGQVVSLLLALGSLASSLIADLGVDAPLSQSLFAYVLLAVVCGGIMLYRRQRLLVGFSIRILIQRIYHFICTRVCFHDNENRECDKDSILFFQVPWYWYLLLGFVDVQGNYLCK